MQDKTRGARRTRLEGHIEGEVTVLQPVTILEMCELWIQVETFTPLQPESLHEFRLPLGDRHVVIKGRVVYCHPGQLVGEVLTYRCGVEFTEPPAHALEAIRAYLATLDPAVAPRRVVDGELAE
jgi:hypothetical protein